MALNWIDDRQGQGPITIGLLKFSIIRLLFHDKLLIYLYISM